MNKRNNKFNIACDCVLYRKNRHLSIWKLLPYYTYVDCFSRYTRINIVFAGDEYLQKLLQDEK